ncbi:MAG: hypothetical protein M5U16_17110 [Hyphomicrobium sp.]|nr:hypothetical protein [Hyphomicrobium sp.]
MGRPPGQNEVEPCEASVVEKQASATILVLKAGWLRCTPVSSTTTAHPLSAVDGGAAGNDVGPDHQRHALGEGRPDGDILGHGQDGCVAHQRAHAGRIDRHRHEGTVR